MVCDYYIQSILVIEYIDKNSAKSITQTNRIIKKCWIGDIPDFDSDDDYENQTKKYREEIERLIKKNTYKKILFENDMWISSSYEKKYIRDIPFLCRNMVKLVKIYKDYSAWERNS